MATTVSANREVAARMRKHHAQMVQAVRDRMSALERAQGIGADWHPARNAVAAYANESIVPHAKAEEATIYAVAAQHADLRLLIGAMMREHGAIMTAITAVEGAKSAQAALRAGGGVETLFAAHAGIENDVILSRLEEETDVDLGDVLARMEAALAAAAGLRNESAKAAAESPEDVEIDVRTIPHSERHALILGVVRHLRDGHNLLLTADHDPLPLRMQLASEHGERLGWGYRQQGPDTWVVAISLAPEA